MREGNKLLGIDPFCVKNNSSTLDGGKLSRGFSAVSRTQGMKYVSVPGMWEAMNKCSINFRKSSGEKRSSKNYFGSYLKRLLSKRPSFCNI